MIQSSILSYNSLKDKIIKKKVSVGNADISDVLPSRYSGERCKLIDSENFLTAFSNVICHWQ